MPISPDSMLGPYRIAGIIGEGGMGVVYRAKDTRLGRDHLLHLLEADAAAADLRWLEPNIREVYENVSTLMKSFCE